MLLLVYPAIRRSVDLIIRPPAKVKAKSLAWVVSMTLSQDLTQITPIDRNNWQVYPSWTKY
jgi:hypothetical protein